MTKENLLAEIAALEKRKKEAMLAYAMLAMPKELKALVAKAAIVAAAGAESERIDAKKEATA